MNMPLRRRSEVRCIEPGEWPARTGRARVLIEHPDRAALWAEAEIIREAGYDVAVCTGPVEAADGVAAEACPLLVQGRCSLVDEADVVVSTTDLRESRGILAAIGRRRAPALVVESTQSVLERGGHELGDATVVEVPVTERRLLDAVSGALSKR